ncbi:MAG: hypothetical protein ACK5HT_10020, partial [Draconibacterium sp.]
EVEELDLPDDRDFEVLKDETIKLSSVAAIKAGMADTELRRVAIYFEETDLKTKTKKHKVIVTLIRVCLMKYELLAYIVNDIRTVVTKVDDYKTPGDHKQLKIKLKGG